MSEPTEQTPAEAPVALHVVKGNPTPEELAALIAVVAASGGPEAAPEKPRSLWASPARRHRTPVAPGRGAWRASALAR